MEVAQGLAISLEYAGLTIGDRMGLTKYFDRRLCRFELVPGHMGEEVMLNLIVQAAKPEVGERVRSDISGREDLLSDPIERTVALEHEHPLMIGCKGGAHIQSKKHLVHQNESHPLPHPQEREHAAQVDQDVDGYERRLDGGKLGALGQQKLDAVEADGEALQQ